MNKFRKNGSKALAVILAVVLVVGGIVGTTMAWLMAETEDVVNTFTYGDINLELDETERDEDGNTVDEDKDGLPDRTDEGNDYEMMPGEDIEKDPEVRVAGGSEDAWLFVKLEEKGGNVTVDGVEYTFDDFLVYHIAEGWTPLKDADGNEVEGVYFRPVWQNENVSAYNVLMDNKVTVKDTVTKEMLNALNPEDAPENFPQLVITAYAVQYVGFEAEDTDNEDQMNAAAYGAWSTVVVPELANP